MAEEKREIWFATYRSAGMFVRQVPVHWKGWIIQLGALAVFFIIEVGAMNLGLLKEYFFPCAMVGLIVFFAIVFIAGRRHSEKRY